MVYNVINQVFRTGPVRGPRSAVLARDSYGSEVCCISPRPKAACQYSRSRTRNWTSTKLLD